MMTIDKALLLASRELKWVDRPRLEAEILLSYYLDCDRVSLHLNSQKEIKDFERFWELIKRRANFEPIEYITNQVSFYSEDFFIRKGALIPRPETELLVDRASEFIERFDIKKIAEIGVGSGAISVILAKKYPHLQIIATDISTDALKIAWRNIILHQVEGRVELVESSLLDEVGDEIELIVSNPPYIPKDTTLEPNVVDFEPQEALFAEDNGTELLKEIVKLGVDRNIKALTCEMGYDQKEMMERFLISLGVGEFGFYRDLAGLDRGFWVIF